MSYNLDERIVTGEKPHRPKYWYRTTIQECPICGRGDTYRERMYTKKPADVRKRYIYETHYDWCMEYDSLPNW